jgi:hypothetical protein
MVFDELLTRAMDVTSKTVDPHTKQRISTAAQDLSMAGELQARLDVCNAAIAGLIAILYDVDADGVPVNYDRATYRLLIPVPWGEAGGLKWGLRQWEARCLRRLLLNRVGANRRMPSLFDYDEYSRQWSVDLTAYPHVESALEWLRKDPPTLAEWRVIVEDFRAETLERMNRLRGRLGAQYVRQ